MGLFFEDIVVTINDQSVTFRANGKSTDYRKLVYISYDKPPVVISVGSDQIPLVPAKPVSLILESAVSDEVRDCWVTFFKYCTGLSLTTLQKFMKPKVIVSAAGLSQAQRDFFGMVVKEAGAREVVFN